MPRLLVPLNTPDVSTFTKTLGALLNDRHAANKPLPGHVELLNLLARAAGLRNFATLKAVTLAAPKPAESMLANPIRQAQSSAAINLSTLSATARKALQQFDEARRMVRLPSKLSVQQLCMWVFWTQFQVRRIYTEREVNAILNAHHTFGDPATLRRELINMKLLSRKSDCSEYWKEPLRPAAEVQAFLKAWRAGLR